MSKKIFIATALSALMLFGCSGNADIVSEDVSTQVKIEETLNNSSKMVFDTNYLEYGYKVYTYSASPEPISPSITLHNDGRFSFGYSGFSSYMPFGEYELTDSTLTLRTDDGVNTYVFDVLNETFVFNESLSSKIPSYKYSSNAVAAECPVPDGAVFEYKEEKVYYDAVKAITKCDIDGDGEEETVSIGPGNTSGRFTFTLNAVKKDGTKYKTVHHGGTWEDFGFETIDGKVCFYAIDYNTGEKIYSDIILEDEAVLLKEIK